MQHGNKKYNFEELEKVNDSIVVKPKNVYSLKNQARLFIKENGNKMKFNYSELANNQILVTRIQ